MSDMIAPMNWTDVINKAMERTGLTMSAIAKRVGYSQGALSDLYTKRRKEPRYSVGAKLVELAGVQQQDRPTTA